MADGLDAIDRPVDTVIIAGIGGKTIAGILSKHSRIQDANLIVSAHTNLPFLRETLNKYSYSLQSETVVRASGRYYTVIEAEKGENFYSPKQLYIGINLCDSDGHTLIDYLSWRIDVINATRTPEKAMYLEWLNEEIDRAKHCNKSNNL